jgi:hypothetical protein
MALPRLRRILLTGLGVLVLLGGTGVGVAQAEPRPRFWVLGFGEGRDVP